MSAVGKFFKKVGTGIWHGVQKVAGFAGDLAPTIGGLFGPQGAAIGAGIGAAGKLIGGIGKKEEQPAASVGMPQISFGAPPSMRGDMGGMGRQPLYSGGFNSFNENIGMSGQQYMSTMPMRRQMPMKRFGSY